MSDNELILRQLAAQAERAAIKLGRGAYWDGEFIDEVAKMKKMLEEIKLTQHAQ